MFLRLLSFTLLQLLGAGLGWWLAAALHGTGWWPLVGALLAGLGASWLWFLADWMQSVRWLRWLRQGTLDSMPKLRGVYAEISDRTRRLLHQRERKWHESQARLQEFLAALQASPNGVVLLDAQGQIEWCNHIAAVQFGFDAERDLRQAIGHLVRDPVFAAYYATFDSAQAARAEQQEVVITGRHSTPQHPVRLSLYLSAYAQGRKLLLARDVTALEQAEAMRRDFVANVSHEIRTPLTVLSGFVETLQTLELSAAERAHYLRLMAEQAERMQAVVRDLLTLSRLEGNPLPGLGEWFSLATCTARIEQEARALSALLHGSQPAQQLHFDWPASADCASMAGQQHELHSALSNLVGNAIRYTEAGGRVAVRWQWLADGRAEFSVQDNGPGIAPEHLPRLSERFYRIERSRSRNTGGTGLGLAIVKHAAQRHGAVLQIESRLGQGSRFALTFPANRLRPPGAGGPPGEPGGPG